MSARRRILIFLLVAVAAVGIAALLALRHYSRPEQTARLLRDFVKTNLRLDLEFEGAPQLDVWPRLGLNLQSPRLITAEGKRLLDARTLHLVLPWSSLHGETLQVDSLDIAAPRLDLDALDAWLAGSESSAMPDVRLGLSLREGTVQRGKADIAGGVSLDGDLDLRRLDGWWRQLGAATQVDQLLPPGEAHLHIDTLRLGDALLEGVDLRNTP